MGIVTVEGTAGAGTAAAVALPAEHKVLPLSVTKPKRAPAKRATLTALGGLMQSGLVKAPGVVKASGGGKASSVGKAAAVIEVIDLVSDEVSAVGMGRGCYGIAMGLLCDFSGGM